MLYVTAVAKLSKFDKKKKLLHEGRVLLHEGNLYIFVTSGKAHCYVKEISD